MRNVLVEEFSSVAAVQLVFNPVGVFYRLPRDLNRYRMSIKNGLSFLSVEEIIYTDSEFEFFRWLSKNHPSFYFNQVTKDHSLSHDEIKKIKIIGKDISAQL